MKKTLLEEIVRETQKTNELLSLLLADKNKKETGSFDDLPVMLSYNHLMDVLRISKETAYKLMHSKGFPSVRIGRNLKVPKDSLFKWIQKKDNSQRVLK